MDVSTVASSGPGSGTIIPRRGTRSYALLWPLQYLSGFIMAVVTLAEAIRSNAYTPFEGGSALLFALGYALTFFAFTPAAPIAGWAIDRWGPKKTLLAGNVGYLVVMVVAVLALASHTLYAWLVLASLLGRTASQSAQIAGLEASVPVLVPKRDIARANGSRMFLTASVAGFEAPLASALLPATGLLVLILATSVVVIASIVIVARADYPSSPLPLPATAATRSAATRQGYGPLLTYFRNRRGLLAILVLFLVFNFAIGFTEVADKAITNDFGSADTLNIVLGAGFVAMLATTIAITIWGTPREPVRWLRGYFVLFGLALVLGAIRPNLLVVTVAAVLFLGSAPFVMAIISTLLHTKTEPVLMGRMMGAKTMVIGIAYGCGNVLGALCAAVPKPLIGGNRLSHGFLAFLVGTGQAEGRGFAFMAMILGLVTVVAVLLIIRRPAVRDLDGDLPDVTPEDLLRGHAAGVPQARLSGPVAESPLPAPRPAQAAGEA